MNVALFSGVPPNLFRAAMDIEERSGILFEVAQADAQLRKEFPSLAEMPLLDIYPDVQRICVWYPDAFISIHELSHEIIHARRNILQSVPRLVPLRRARRPELIYALENDLEHLSIIPEEISYFPSRDEVWASLYVKYISGSGSSAFNLFRHWVVINRVLSTHVSLIQQCRVKLVELGLLELADRFRSEIEMAAANKIELIRVSLKWFPQMRNDICVQRYVVANSSLGVVSVAA